MKTYVICYQWKIEWNKLVSNCSYTIEAKSVTKAIEELKSSSIFDSVTITNIYSD